MVKLLKIAELGEEVLFRKAKPVKDVNDLEIQELIDDMIATLKHDNGVGLAAPQVFQSLRIIIVWSYPNPRYPDAPEFGPIAIINPEITVLSEEKEKGWEGCLSIPGIRGQVSRYKSIKVNFITRKGARQEATFNGFVARIIQHEEDHLNGKLCFLNVNEDIKDLATDKIWQKQMTEKWQKEKSKK
ncbi:MAG: peptide deformylase [Candidatus Nealsonbacteria bacterium]|nr:peptide deformylase [Candidatus Nealsonbacteria bacterium]